MIKYEKKTIEYDKGKIIESKTAAAAAAADVEIVMFERKEKEYSI